MRTVLTAALAVAATAVVPPATAAPAPRPVVMVASGGEQPGVLVESVTHRGKGRRCSDVSSVSTTSRPDAVKHDGGPLSWRIPDRRRPARTALRMVQSSFRDDTTGFHHEVTSVMSVKLAPVTVRGRVVAWTATTDGSVRYADYDIWFKAVWVGDCGNDSVEYRFHARSLPVHP